MLRAAEQGALVTRVGPDATELARAFPDIAAGLGAVPEAVTSVEDDPQAARQRHLESICHLFTSIARQQPLVLFLDDLQWAPSMDAVQALAQRASTEPLLLIGAYRESEVRDSQALSRAVLAMNRDRLLPPVPPGRRAQRQGGGVVQAWGRACGRAGSVEEMAFCVVDIFEV